MADRFLLHGDRQALFIALNGKDLLGIFSYRRADFGGLVVGIVGGLHSDTQLVVSGGNVQVSRIDAFHAAEKYQLFGSFSANVMCVKQAIIAPDGDAAGFEMMLEVQLDQRNLGWVFWRFHRRDFFLPL